ncbi:MAG TPA: hypothetical protein VNN80_01765 [Polyangiaceae bacterium]|nr:hypothetical protein [Polyangiaceae bacterium]
MTLALSESSVDRVVDFPWEVLEYRAWLGRQPSARDAARGYLFEEPRVRFRPEPADILVAERDVQVALAGSCVTLTAPRASGAVRVDGLAPSQREIVVGLLAELDGQRPLAAIRAALDPDRAAALDALLDAAFGKLIFAPIALLAAERSISGVEITRFPGSPYEIARTYWLNMGAVRARLEALLGALDDDQRFVRELRRLHVVALMGPDLTRYYQPSSPISNARATPGRLLLDATELVDTPQGSLIMSGVRVAAAPVGGARYQELLGESLGEPEASEPRELRAADGLAWGRLVRARAVGEAADALWFVPPRPLTRLHLRALREALGAADRAARSRDRDGCGAALAAFHQLFVRLHPFYCGNQSLAMNIANGVAQRGLGAGMPHLMLDHLAFRLSPDAYGRVFARAAAVYVDPQAHAAARYQRLASNRAQTFSLLEKLDTAPSLDAARALLRADPEGAALLLLCNP